MRESTKIVIIVFCLVAIGVVMIYSTSAIYASTRYQDYLYFFKRSLIWILLSVAGFFVGYFISYKWMGKCSFFVFLFAMGLLFLVFTPFGVEAGGARRWVNLRFLSFQPSEIMKFASVLFLSSFMAKHHEKSGSLTGFFIPVLMIISLSTLPIFAEPDFGTSALIGSVGMMILIVAGAKIRYIAFLFFSMLPAVYLTVVQVPYRLQRVLVFLDPWKEAKSTGYQIIQSFIAIQSGGIFGVGLGESRQKLFYLPEAHTDFIFSILGEELGFLGAVGVVVLFFLFIYYGLKIALRADNPFGKFFASGLVAMIGIQAFLNMGVVTGVLPTKGLPLPFISYGGTNLVMTMVAVGVILNIDRFSREKTALKVSVKEQKTRISKYVRL
ncbi:MAG: putative lipid II flippase FtsW [Candidatus Aureabacteria bacterium]|nr:putative lipid II flippase FtsW [Candidatus Auribacterota bacterium]